MLLLKLCSVFDFLEHKHKNFLLKRFAINEYIALSEVVV